MSGFQGVLVDWYLWLKALHVISVIAWMAGLLYLPRLFVYHVECGGTGGEISEMLKVMEGRLLKYIMGPAMISAWVFGGLMLAAGVVDWSRGWPWVKAVLVLAMSAYHGRLARWQQDFAADRNTRPALHYRVANEVPAVMMIVIVLMAVAEPI